MLLNSYRKARERFINYRCLGTKVPITNLDGTNTFEYSWKTFDEVYQETQYLAAVLKDYELFSTVSDPDFNLDLRVVGLSSVNREEWVVTDLAANLLGITTVPLYETLGLQMLEIILEQTEMQTIFGSEKSLLNMLNCEAGEAEERLKAIRFIRKVVCFDTPSEKLTEVCSRVGVQLFLYHELMEKCK